MTNFNFIYYTDITDSWNHAYGKYSFNNQFLHYRLSKLFLALKKWVWDNPDYNLIIMSDHGGKCLKKNISLYIIIIKFIIIIFNILLNLPLATCMFVLQFV